MDSMSKTDILHTGRLYNPNDSEIMQEQKERLRMLKDYNDTDPADFVLRENKLREMFEYFGHGAYIEIPFRANWAGKFVHFGDGCYANFNLTLVDETHIFSSEITQCWGRVSQLQRQHILYLQSCVRKERSTTSLSISETTASSALV